MRHLWGICEASGADERLAQAAAVLERHGELALRVVDESLRSALRRAAEEVGADQARRVTNARQ